MPSYHPLHYGSRYFVALSAVLLITLFLSTISFKLVPLQLVTKSNQGSNENIKGNRLQAYSLHGDEVTSGGATDSSAFLDWMKYVDSLKGEKESVYDSIVEYDVLKKTIVYECTLGRSLGIEISQGEEKAVVSEVVPMSYAHQIGIEVGDTITAIQATAGDQLWEHVTEESVRAALNTRFVMNSSAKLRLERPVSSIDQEKLGTLLVPYYYDVKLRRPLGLHVVEGPQKKVYVESIKADGGAAKTKTIEVGDQVVSMRASWGDRMWEVNSVESFVVSIRMRSDPTLSFRMKRLMTLAKYMKSSSNRFVRKDYSMSYRSRVMGLESGQVGSSADHAISKDKLESPPISFKDALEKCETEDDLENTWARLLDNRYYGVTIDNYSVNMIMTKALSLECPAFATQVFEDVYNFHYEAPNPARDALKASEERGAGAEMRRGGWSASVLAEKRLLRSSSLNMLPNNYVCTTAIKVR